MRALRKFLENSNGSHLFCQQRRPVDEHICHLWVVRTERFLPNLRRPLRQRLCLRVLSLQRDNLPECQPGSQKHAVSRELPNKNFPIILPLAFTRRFNKNVLEHYKVYRIPQEVSWKILMVLTCNNLAPGC